MIGTSISHYTILEKFGGGGMGVVYKAEDTKLKRFVALKFLPSELTTDDDAKERFIREAQAASALQHNNICTVHDIDETKNGQIFIVMDLYEGETLKEKIARGPMRPDDAAGIATQIAEGLARAHERKIVHRDIKPANILVTNDGVVKIVDFGLAKFIHSPHVTREGRRAGTTMYMSPEQLRGEAIDAGTDIWSFGVLLYQMLTGIHPFDAEFDESVMYRIITDEPVPVATAEPDVPKNLSDLVMMCLQKEKAKRPQSMEEILKILGAYTGVRGLYLTRKLIGRIAAVAGIVITVSAVGFYFAWDLLFPPPPQNIRLAVLLFVDETKNTSVQTFNPEIQRLFEREFVNVNRVIMEQRLQVNASIRQKFNQENPLRSKEFLRFLRQQGYEYVIDGSITNSPTGGMTIQANLLKANAYDPVGEFQGHLTSERQIETVVQDLAREVRAYLRMEILEEKPKLGIWSKKKPNNYGALDRLYKAYEFYCVGDMRSANAALRESVALDSTFVSPRVWLSSYYRRYDIQGGRENLGVLNRLRPSADKFEQVMIDWSDAFTNYACNEQIRFLRRALEFEPTNRVLLANLAGAYDEKHDTLRALEAYRYCVSSKWEFRPFYQVVVQLDLGLRWYDSARVALHTWSEVDTASYSPLLYGWLHAVHLRVGETAEAAKWRDRYEIVCADSGIAGKAFTLGACYADVGLLPKGDSLMNLAIALDKNNPVYREKFGSVLLAYGDVEGALRELSTAAQLKPKSKSVMLKLGNIFQQKGDTLRALEQYKKFRALDSTGYDAQQIQKWMQTIHR